MGFFDFFSPQAPRRAAGPDGGLRTTHRRARSEGGRASQVGGDAASRCGATSIASLEESERRVKVAKDNESQARVGGDADTAAVLLADQRRFAHEQTHLREQREKVVVDAAALTEAVQGIERELETLRRERDTARVQLTAANLLTASRPALEDRIDELLELDAARDEVERAHALAQIYKEDADTRGER